MCSRTSARAQTSRAPASDRAEANLSLRLSTFQHRLRQHQERFFHALGGLGAGAYDRPAAFGELDDPALVELADPGLVDLPFRREIGLVEHDDERDLAGDSFGFLL